jgi:DNA helicase-2/ATP-dependent DNA helicase PcrA
MPPYAAINYIRYGIRYETYLKEYAAYRKIKPEELIETLNEIGASAKPFKTFQEWFDYMADYKENLVKQAKNQGTRQDGITISTLHSAKGLEYEKVFILDVNEGIMPYQKAALEDDLEEERRLFYVGMTRAKENLHLYYIEKRFERELKPSRFLTEIKS